MKQKLVLVDPEVNYLQHLPLEGNPWDVAINKENDAYVTVPNKRCVLAIDPDHLFIFREIVLDYRPICISAISGRAIFRLGALDVKKSSHRTMSVRPKAFIPGISENDTNFYMSKFRKLHCNPTAEYLCNAGQNSITIKNISKVAKLSKYCSYNTYQDMLDVPSDICGDDNEHIYVCGQYSHNILRLTKELKLVDIPLSSQHGIQYPVAICFNKDYNKMYIANDWGRSILAYNVV